MLFLRSTTTTFQLRLRLPGGLVPSLLPTNSIRISVISDACTMPRPPHRPCLLRPGNIRVAYFYLEVHSTFP
jgi:hypothetical protein